MSMGDFHRIPPDNAILGILGKHAPSLFLHLVCGRDYDDCAICPISKRDIRDRIIASTVSRIAESRRGRYMFGGYRKTRGRFRANTFRVVNVGGAETVNAQASMRVVYVGRNNKKIKCSAM